MSENEIIIRIDGKEIRIDLDQVWDEPGNWEDPNPVLLSRVPSTGDREPDLKVKRGIPGEGFDMILGSEQASIKKLLAVSAQYFFELHDNPQRLAGDFSAWSGGWQRQGNSDPRPRQFRWEIRRNGGLILEGLASSAIDAKNAGMAAGRDLFSESWARAVIWEGWQLWTEAENGELRKVELEQLAA
jgi:hypothetical protein